MNIQFNTDHCLPGSEALTASLETEVRSALERFADRVTRVELHLSDLNSHKSGGDDKRCLMEARVAGRQPLSVSHQAPSMTQAVHGASGKLVRALDTVFGKLDAARRSSGRPNPEEPAP